MPNAKFVLTSCVELASCYGPTHLQSHEAMRVFTRFCSCDVSHIARISLATVMNTTAFCILETVGKCGGSGGVMQRSLKNAVMRQWMTHCNQRTRFPCDFCINKSHYSTPNLLLDFQKFTGHRINKPKEYGSTIFLTAVTIF
jgi:hypothetical protein